MDRNRGHRRSGRRCARRRAWCGTGAADQPVVQQTLPLLSTAPADIPPLQASRSPSQHLLSRSNGSIPAGCPPSAMMPPSRATRRSGPSPTSSCPSRRWWRTSPPPRLCSTPSNAAEGRLERLRGRLAKSQNTLGRSMLGLLGGGDLDEDSWEDVEDTLLIADLGPVVTESVVASLRSRMASSNVRTETDARAVLREVLIEELQPDLDRSIKALPHDDKPVGAAGRRGQRHRQDHDRRQAGARAGRRRPPGRARRGRHLPGRRRRPAAELGVPRRRPGGARRRGRRPGLGGVRRRGRGHRRPAPTSSSSTPRGGCTPRPA